MVYVRGHDQDYNAWAELGNVGWDFKSVLPYFKKSEDNTEPSTVDYKSKSFHGVGGYLPISNFTTNNSFVHVLRSAFGQIGVREIRDYNSGEHIGFVEIQGTIRGGERSSAARAFLLPIKSRSNIKIMKGSQVNKILFSGSKAIGVNVSTADKDCKNILLYASKEIIVSAGAVNSPKILLLSGIGRSEDLNTFGISQVKDLAVGDNLQDHPAAIFFLRVKPNSPEQTVFDLLSDVKDYFFHRSGTFSSVGSTSFHGYVNTTHPNATYPDAQFIFNHFRRSQKGLNIVFEKFGYRDEFIAQLLQVNINFELVLVYVNLFNPKSVGSVKLRSGNHWDAPKITTGYLKAHEDIDSLLRISKKLRELVTTPAMKEISAEIVKFNITECDLLPYPSDKYDKCYLSYFTQSGYHPSGTCKMGPGSDLNAVVDERLRVHGVQGLRVADASIMPRIPSANPQASIYMIGEKAADMIKEDWFDEQPKHTTVKTVTIKNREL